MAGLDACADKHLLQIRYFVVVQKKRKSATAEIAIPKQRVIKRSKSINVYDTG